MEVATSVKTALPIIGGILTFLAIAVCCHGASPTPFDASKIDYSQFTQEEVDRTAAHRDQLKEQHRQELEHVGEVANAQGATLNEVQVALSQAKSSFLTYQAASEEQINKGNQAIAAWESEHKKHVRAQWILIGLWIALVVLIYTKLPIEIKGYGIYGAAGAIVIGSAFIKLWL